MKVFSKAKKANPANDKPQPRCYQQNEQAEELSLSILGFVKLNCKRVSTRVIIVLLMILLFLFSLATVTILLKGQLPGVNAIGSSATGNRATVNKR